MTRSLWATTAALVLAGSGVLAQEVVGSSRELASRLQAQGYTRVEIDEGPTQTKVEAVRGNEKLEYVFDRATGQILKQEVERPDGDDLRPGVEIDREDEDWVRGPGAVLDGDDDDDDDDRRGRGGDDDDDDDDRRSGRDDDDDNDDDDEGDDRRGRGGDDDSDDD